MPYYNTQSLFSALFGAIAYSHTNLRSPYFSFPRIFRGKRGSVAVIGVDYPCFQSRLRVYNIYGISMPTTRTYFLASKKCSFFATVPSNTPSSIACNLDNSRRIFFLLFTTSRQKTHLTLRDPIWTVTTTMQSVHVII